MQSATALAILGEVSPSLPLRILWKDQGKDPLVLELTTVAHVMTQLMQRPASELVTIHGSAEVNISHVLSVLPRHGGPKIEQHVELSGWRTKNS